MGLGGRRYVGNVTPAVPSTSSRWAPAVQYVVQAMPQRVVRIGVVLSVGCAVSNLRRSVDADAYIEGVFENDLAELDAASTLAAPSGPTHRERDPALDRQQAAVVDGRIAPLWARCRGADYKSLLDAAIIEADPVGAEHRAVAAAAERFGRLGRSNEHGLKLIIARANAGDAIWFKATIDRIADILGRQGDTDTVEIRRSKAIGILAQPAEALQLLCQHQDDEWGGPDKPAEEAHIKEANTSEQEAGADEQLDFAETISEDSEPATVSEQAADNRDGVDEDSRRSLQISRPPFDPARARPRAIVYVHLGAEAVTAGTGIARVENVGPILHRSVARPARRPLHDRSEAGHRSARRAYSGRSYEIPAACGSNCCSQSGRCVPLRHCGEPPDRC